MFRRMVVIVMIAGIAGIGTMLALPPALAAQGSPSATDTRSFSPASVTPGGRVIVTIAVANYGSTGTVTETLPAGFTYVSSSPSSLNADTDRQSVNFTLGGDTSFTYTVTAPSVEGSYAFSGTLRDSEGNDRPVGGAVTVTVASDPLVTRYDANNNGQIDRSEVIRAINDYLFGGEGDTISRADVIKVINLYLFGSTPAPTAQPPGAPTGLTATAGGQTRIDLSWNAPASNGGAAITGYRIEVSTDRSSWSSLAANTGSTATRYSHTGLTAGNARHYRVSAINSAGTGPASNVATATTDTTAQAPDLVVDPPTVTSNSPDAGASFTLSATVRNGGDGSSGSTTLSYYRSTDSAITSSDTQVGTDSVGGLAASAASNESIELTAPSSAGTYYYGACVEPVSGEDSTGNNCSDAVAVTVVERPDLVVEQPSVTSSSPDAGASFTLYATVRNRGSGSSAPTTLRYHRSTDSAITSSDTQVGKDPVGGLAASGTSNQSIDLTAESVVGTYYYGACVDQEPSEANTGNNCSAAVEVKVVQPPDLVVERLWVSGSSSPDAGAPFTLNARVRNRGSGSSAPTTLRYHRSTDETITPSDTQVGNSPVVGVTASGSHSLSIELTAPSEAGTYYYGACVDPVSGEANTGNNCSAAAEVTVVGRPDLVVQLASVNDPNPDAGASFTLSVRVLNRGISSSAETTLTYHRSPDSAITPNDTQVGMDPVKELAPSGSIAESIDLTAPTNGGTYYYGACVEARLEESNIDNNCSEVAVKVEVTVG